MGQLFAPLARFIRLKPEWDNFRASGAIKQPVRLSSTNSRLWRDQSRPMGGNGRHLLRSGPHTQGRRHDSIRRFFAMLRRFFRRDPRSAKNIFKASRMKNHEIETHFMKWNDETWTDEPWTDEPWTDEPWTWLFLRLFRDFFFVATFLKKSQFFKKQRLSSVCTFVSRDSITVYEDFLGSLILKSHSIRKLWFFRSMIEKSLCTKICTKISICTSDFRTYALIWFFYDQWS